MKVLVTGATGFIGDYVIKELLKLKDLNIIATSIISVDDASNISWFNEVEYISCNLNEENSNYFSYFKEPDILIHLSWEGLPNFKERYHFEVNTFTNYEFIKNLVQNGLKDLNVIGTCFEYGMQSGCLSEDLPAEPITAYGLGKDTLRRFLIELQKSHDFTFKWIRLFYLYGIGQSAKSILPQLDKSLDNNDEIFNMSGGAQIRDYLPVEKVAEYIVQISLQIKVLGIVNCCSGTPISIKELVDNHMKKRNKTIKLNLGHYPYPDYVPMEFWGDNSKLQSILKE